MSSDKTSSTNGRPILKPSLPSHGRQPPRVPFTPRVAVSAAPSTARAGTLSPAGRPIVKAPSPKVPQQHKQDGGVGTANAGAGNITPRSAARSLRADSGQQNDAISVRPRSTGNAAGSILGSYPTRPKSTISEAGSTRGQASPGVRAPENPAPSMNGSIEERFFHASDVQKQEPVPKKPEPKRAPAFFYADGKREPSLTRSPENLSPAASSVAPIVSAASEQSRTSAQPYSTATLPRSPVVSPGFSHSGGSPFFPSPSTQSPSGMRSPSPSKENIHLSYRKGVSQIFGSRPFPLSQPSSTELQNHSIPEELSSTRSPTFHRKASSISSLDSGNSPSARRRSGTTVEGGLMSSSPLAQEFKSSGFVRPDQPKLDLSSIEPVATPGAEGPLSPTRGAIELAAEARRERKVLDLEISNSSLLAINSSLEREVRRQKAELKRFRRLSRAGRFSFAVGDGGRRRSSDAMSTLSEVDEEASNVGSDDGFNNDMDSSSDDESDSGGSSEAMSERRESREHDRLAKDEKRLRVDLARHKELLTQSQMMNQSIKRCMYATEEMIADGRKALEYHVRVSDVKLGGRILTQHDDEDSRHEIEVEDHEFSSELQQPEDGSQDDDMEGADQLLKVWQGVGRPSIESSEGGDRDSGIEVDKSYFPMTHHTMHIQTGGSEASALPPVLPG